MAGSADHSTDSHAADSRYIVNVVEPNLRVDDDFCDTHWTRAKGMNGLTRCVSWID